MYNYCKGQIRREATGGIIMTESEKKTAARKFAKRWENKGQEDEHGRSFWLDLMQNVLGIENAVSCVEFEKKVKPDDGSTKRIDVYIPHVNVLIEQKSLGVDLDKPQPGHNNQTPYEQAKSYDYILALGEKAKWIIVSNFKETRIYNMYEDVRGRKPTVIMLSELPEKFHCFDILYKEEAVEIRVEEQISVKAGEITGKLYDAFIKRYADPDSPETLRSLNQLCVRLVFCLYAEDSGVFDKDQFHDYISAFKPEHIRSALKALFKMLDTPDDGSRDSDEEKALLAFPYVNGGLFADETIKIPQFDEETKRLLLDEASAGIDWSGISPTIFGAVFESTLNPETRRKGGMHYTSVENIHKVIDPLFLDELKAELEKIKRINDIKKREKAAQSFRKRLSELTFFDPACGSGNFLTETYLSLRRLENEALKLCLDENQQFMENMICVEIKQFYGIEINNFAVTVAKTALWIAENQMLQETESIVNEKMDFLPLKTNANIIEGNALRLDWAQIVPQDKLSYIMGNPPFVGYSLQSKEQKADILSTYVDEKGKPYKTAGKIDYVSGWYFKASRLMQGTNIKTGFVSTNSITQGEQVAGVWKPLFERFNIHIDFAYRTFKWSSEATDTAAVHCVIIGFSIAESSKPRIIYIGENAVKADNINPYLVDAENVFIESRSTPICDVPEMSSGGKPTDDSNLILTEEEKEELLSKEPQAEIFIRPFMMGKDFIQRKPRYCLWLVNADPQKLRKCPLVMDRVKKVREYRLKSNKAATRKKAEKPTLFDEIKESKTDYVAIPKVSSENRKYIPIDYLSADVIAGDKLFMIPNTDKYTFGILNSGVHMTWMRAVCGRLKSDYSYSNTIVYNNFPWCTPTPEQKAKIEQTAQGILDARALFPDSSLAYLYDEHFMPQELRKAHKANNQAVAAAYGFPKNITDSECTAELMKLYKALSEPKK